MTFFDALLLGLIQGLTEFFPISSSAHLRIAKHLLGLPSGEELLYFDLMCHLGTTCALLFAFRKEILSILQVPRRIAPYALALLPLFPAYFLLKPLRIALSDPHYLGYFLWVSALLLLLAVKPLTSSRPYRDAFLIGAVQSLALIPGISRSGSTISTARLLGWEWKEAARFSFLLAAPAVMGGALLETMKLFSHTIDAMPLSPILYFTGFATSLGSGLFGVQLLFRLLERGSFRPFAAYLFLLGLLAKFLFV